MSKVYKSNVNHVKKQTNNPYLNIYELESEFRNGRKGTYYMASRRKDADKVRAVTHDRKSDGVVIYSLYGEKKDKVVLVRQFRFPVNDYVYEFPAGLMEAGEDIYEAAQREIYEETGLTFTPKKVSESCYRPFFTTVGMTDECCGTVYGYCSGTPTNINQEGSEDIEVVLADREECRRILREENVAIMCAYMLMHFIHSGEEDPLDFLDDI